MSLLISSCPRSSERRRGSGFTGTDVIRYLKTDFQNNIVCLPTNAEKGGLALRYIPILAQLFIPTPFPSSPECLAEGLANIACRQTLGHRRQDLLRIRLPPDRQ